MKNKRSNSHALTQLKKHCIQFSTNRRYNNNHHSHSNPPPISANMSEAAAKQNDIDTTTTTTSKPEITDTDSYNQAKAQILNQSRTSNAHENPARNDTTGTYDNQLNAKREHSELMIT